MDRRLCKRSPRLQMNRGADSSAKWPPERYARDSWCLTVRKRNVCQSEAHLRWCWREIRGPAPAVTACIRKCCSHSSLITVPLLVSLSTAVASVNLCLEAFSRSIAQAKQEHLALAIGVCRGKLADGMPPCIVLQPVNVEGRGRLTEPLDLGPHVMHVPIQTNVWYCRCVRTAY